MNQDNSFTLNRENIKIWSKLTILFFFWPFGGLLWSKWTYWHESYKILSGIFWHKFRVPTRGYFGSKWSVQAQKWPKMLNFKNNHMVLIFPKSMCCGYSKLVPGDVWRDANWINKGYISLKWPVQPQKWPKMVNFQKYSHVCGVVTKMSEKQRKWSILTTFLTFSQFNIIELSWFIFHLVRHLLGQV